MSRLSDLDARYSAISSVVRNRVELVAVHDPPGAYFNTVVIEMVRKTSRDGPGIWDNLLARSKRLRYLLVSEPAPFELNARLGDALTQLHQQADQLLGATNNPELIRKLLQSADAIATSRAAVGTELLRSVLESGASNSIVVVANPRAKEALRPWLVDFGVRLLSIGELKQEPVAEEISYFVGPPRYFPSHSITAPLTNEITFVFPSWFSDRRVQTSVLSQISERPIQVEARLYEVGLPEDEDAFDETFELSQDIEDELLPQPNWGQRQSDNREPKEDEVEARKLLLSGGLGLWLDDDGERIRTLNPRQPAGDRVGYMDIADVQAGIFLLLREGASEGDTLQELAFRRLGSRGKAVRDSQLNWKMTLARRIQTSGINSVERELRILGISAFKQAKAWSLPNTIRPQRDQDFELLLAWLQKDSSKSFELANLLRREILRASHDLRDRLESAANDSDINKLELHGLMKFDLDEPGYHGMFAARVLAVAPFTEIVSRNEIRLPFKEEAAQWLE